MIMIDTDVLIWYLRGNTKAKETIEKLSRTFFSTTINTRRVNSY